ncbi:MAG: glycerol-3-phosphate dehydrogenase subunit GlpB [Actinomyces urogenitalis]|uniref:glycerol-3-phosphate dehydrogenase subunit GlpB n=1 Tax=Actinomyces urogenitalis TaxID=103621 RepID=UPI002A83C136|nr:glycerol-3-phosphate dehydrogenase subunit GlpB [Actinomyces urogenitalis]MDY3678161.1 glycerol-3-phosphate dehydrogenase subunit GlpB [Actinomyces urogenitalis]
MSSDVVVVGAGIAGYATALWLRRAGATVTLVTKGVGGLPLSTGTIDVLGRLGGAAGPCGPAGGATDSERMVRRPVARPLSEIQDGGLLPAGHPYLTIGRQAVVRGVEDFAALVGPQLLTWRQDDGAAGPENLWLPTAVGAVRPSFLVPPSMQDSVLTDGGRYLVVGLRRLKDLTPELVAGNLNRTELPGGGRVQARALTIDLEVRDGEQDSSGPVHARALDRTPARESLVQALSGHVREGETVLLPAVLGMEDPQVFSWLSQRLGAPVGEIPLPPPSVPGLRLENRLARLASDERVRLVQGAGVVSAEVRDGRLVSVTSAAAGRTLTHRAGAFVLATGGFESGALTLDSHGQVRETVLGLPVAGVVDDGEENLRRLVHNDYWGKPQGLFRVGVLTDSQMRPIGPDGEPVLDGLRAVGGLLAGAVRWSECSGEGIALGSARAATDSLLAEAEATGGEANEGAGRTPSSAPPSAGGPEMTKETY